MLINIVIANKLNLIERIMLKAKTLLKVLYIVIFVCVCVCVWCVVCVCERERIDRD